MKQPLVIGGVRFASKTEVQGFVRCLLEMSERREPLGDRAKAWVLALLERHPRADEKIGAGVVGVLVDKRLEQEGLRFELVRKDGTTVAFSHEKCLTEPTARSQFMEAARTAVALQVLGFRDQQMGRGVRACALTGAPLSVFGCHVDHQIEFRKLVDAFLTEHSIDLEAVEYVSTNHGMTGLRFRSADLEAAWQRFHEQRAVLRLTTPEANMARERPDLRRVAT